jgi:DNA uptake protein ComE-like DNA-binding protein
MENSPWPIIVLEGRPGLYQNALDTAGTPQRKEMRPVELAQWLAISEGLFSFALQAVAQCAENTGVHMRTSLAVLGLPLLVVCLAGVAQNHPSDPRNVSASSPMATSPENRVDINGATVDALMKVPGITRVWADRIVRFRPYRTKADLEEQGVIPSELYSRIKDFVIAHRQKQ